MRISFDLDDTLICYQPDVPREPPLRWPLSWLVRDEPLRKGARGLVRRLWGCGHEVWIYTTSYRDPLSVRTWLWLHGVHVARVVNQDVHDRELRRWPGSGERPSKNPAAFGVFLHVDDSDGVRMEGERHGFRVVVVSPGDPDWTRKVLAAVGLSG
jgi:hypothetical protein